MAAGDAISSIVLIFEKSYEGRQSMHSLRDVNFGESAAVAKVLDFSGHEALPLQVRGDDGPVGGRESQARAVAFCNLSQLLVQKAAG